MYLAGDSCEDSGMVILPSLLAALFWARLHHGDYIVPRITSHEVSTCRTHLIAVNRSGLESWNLREDMWTEERFLNSASKPSELIWWHELG